MAKADFATIKVNGVQTNKGSGDATVTIGASVNWGRNAKTGDLVVTTGNISKTFKVVQNGASEFIQVLQPNSESILQTDRDKLYVDVSGGNLTIKGYSNSSKLTFRVDDPDGLFSTSGATHYIEDKGNKVYTYGSEDAQPITLPAQYTTDLKGDVNNGANIPDDPGATTRYKWTIVIPFKANTGSKEQNIQLRIQGAGGAVSYVNIVQNAATGFLEIYKDAAHTQKISATEEYIKINANGTSGVNTLYVDSNTSWTIS